MRPAQLAYENGGSHCRRHSVIPSAQSGLRPEPRGGFAPATRLKTKIKTFLRRKTKKRSAPSRWSGPSRTRQGQTKQNLRKPARRGKTTSCSGRGFVGRF